MSFDLDPRFVKDSIHIADLSLCQLRLQNDRRYPWLVLIPKLNGLTEVHQLNSKDQHQLMAESSAVAQVLEQVTGCDKINVANLGNVVSQLHWHVVARFEQDEAWPGPIWGVGQSIPYPDKKRAELVDSILDALQQKLSLNVVV